MNRRQCKTLTIARSDGTVSDANNGSSRSPMASQLGTLIFPQRRDGECPFGCQRVTARLFDTMGVGLQCL
jgi:hypothetical protein